jgi:hypothetical protein
MVRAGSAVHARTALALVELYFAVGSDDTRRAIARVAPDGIDASSIVAWGAGALVDFVLTEVPGITRFANAFEAVNEVRAVSTIDPARTAGALVNVVLALGSIVARQAFAEEGVTQIDTGGIVATWA